jgi:hypothetical protein
MRLRIAGLPAGRRKQGLRTVILSATKIRALGIKWSTEGGAISVRLTKSASMTMLMALLACAVLLGQSVSHVTQLQTFHIDGTIQDYNGAPASGAEVTFQGDKVGKTVKADESGFYEAVLPVGLYTMSTLYTTNPLNPSLPLALQKAPRSTKNYRRPLFRVPSPTKVTLNVTFVADLPCDFGFTVGHIPTADELEHACGGTELFSIPSDDNTPFQLSIRYRARRRDDGGFDYWGDNISHVPVLLAYNLFTMVADKVVYSEKNGTLEATGNVVVESSDGTAQHGDSMIFKIENGKATPLH